MFIMTFLFWGMETVSLFVTTSPAVGFVIPAIILIDELLPAPLGPSNPSISPERESLTIKTGSEIVMNVKHFLP